MTDYEYDPRDELKVARYARIEGAVVLLYVVGTILICGLIAVHIGLALWGSHAS